MADQDAYNMPISTSDAAAMLRRRVAKNEKPYTQEVVKQNNRRVDAWKKNVLDKIADHRGFVPSGRVWGSWQLYDEGMSVREYRTLKAQGMIPEVSSEVLAYWREFFETMTPEEMTGYGSGTISTGWTILNSYIKMWYADQKYECVFSKSDDPLVWEKEYHKHTDLLQGKTLPFGWTEEQLKDIQEKVLSVLTNTVKPQGLSGFH